MNAGAGTAASGCVRCWPDDADAAWDARALLVRELTLVDESHFIVAIQRCPHCHQRFVTMFCETVDWVGGEDPQYRRRMPVGNDEIVQLAAAGAAVESLFATLAPGRRVLFRDWLADGTIRLGWQAGESP